MSACGYTVTEKEGLKTKNPTYMPSICLLDKLCNQKFLYNCAYVSGSVKSQKK